MRVYAIGSRKDEGKVVSQRCSCKELMGKLKALDYIDCKMSWQKFLSQEAILSLPESNGRFVFQLTLLADELGSL